MPDDPNWLDDFGVRGLAVDTASSSEVDGDAQVRCGP